MYICSGMEMFRGALCADFRMRVGALRSAACAGMFEWLDTWAYFGVAVYSAGGVGKFAGVAYTY